MSNDFDPANVPVVQVDPDTVVTRQIGIAPSQLVLATDPQPPPEVIQGSRPAPDRYRPTGTSVCI